MALLLQNLICALILWRSGLGLLIGKFRQFLIICPQHDNGGVHVLLFKIRYSEICLSFFFFLTKY